MMRAQCEATTADDERTNPDVGAMDPVLACARDIIADAGVRARIERAGHAHDVLVVHAPPFALATLHAASAALRALGFRYVTIDVTDA